MAVSSTGTSFALETDHEKQNAIKKLSEHGFPMKQLSLISKVEDKEDHLHLSDPSKASNIPMLVGFGAGPIVGLLTGLGIFAIPGFGFLYGAGAVIGALGGFELGLLGGGLATLLTTLGVKSDSHLKYTKHIEEGKYLVCLHGNLDEIKKAETVLHTEGTHLEFGE